MRKLLGLIAGILIVLSMSSPVMAHEEGVHIGEMEIPLWVVWVGGAVVALIIILFLFSWRNSRKERPQRNDEGGKDEK